MGRYEQGNFGEREPHEHDPTWNQEQPSLESPAHFSNREIRPNISSSPQEKQFFENNEPPTPCRNRYRRNTSVTTAASSAGCPADDTESWISARDNNEENHSTHTTITSAVSRNSSAETSQASQTPTIKMSNSVHPSMPNQYFSHDQEEEEDDVQKLEEEDSDNDSSRSDDDTRGGKSFASSIFASLGPFKSWRDVTLGDIVDGVASIFPQITSGDISSLAQLFFDNLSTVLASLYAIQDLAKIQPTATTAGGSTFNTDDSIEKTVSLATMNKILFENVAPGLGLALFFGNTYYAWMASRQTRKFGRDYTALPTGMSTPYAFFMVFNVICKWYDNCQ